MVTPTVTINTTYTLRLWKILSKKELEKWIWLRIGWGCTIRDGWSGEIDSGVADWLSKICTIPIGFVRWAQETYHPNRQDSTLAPFASAPHG